MSYLFSDNFNNLTGTFSSTRDTPLTMACWIKRSATRWAEVSTDVALMLSSTAGVNANSLSLGTNESAADRVYARTSDAASNSPAIHDFTGITVNDTWVLLVGTFTSDARRDVYIESSSNTNFSPGIRTPDGLHDKLYVGTAATGFNSFTSYIAEVAIWDKVLSAAEIDALQVAAQTGVTPSSVAAANCIGYWPLDTDQATHADQSGAIPAGPTLTVNGAAAHFPDHPTIFTPLSIPTFVGAVQLAGYAPDAIVPPPAEPLVGALQLQSYVPAVLVPAAPYAAQLTGIAPVVNVGSSAAVSAYKARLITFTGLELRGQAPTTTLPNLSANRLNVNGWDSGWPAGLLSNIDERITGADGQTISTTLVGDAVLLDFDDATTLRDIDTVTTVEVMIRARETTGDGAATASLNVELLINSVKQGSTQVTGTLGATFSNALLADAGWNSDWTLAEVNSLQLRITAVNAAAGAPSWALDCIDVNVIFTPLLSYNIYVADGALTLAGQAPGRSVSAEFYTGVPAAATPALLGYAPTLDYSVPAPSGVLQLIGTPSYLDTLTTQLQVTSWDSGWPSGFAGNVDEPSASADGQTVSTTINNDVVVFSLDDVTGTIIVLDDVLSVNMVLRAWHDGTTAELLVELLIDGSSVGSTTQALSTTAANYQLVVAAWDGDWSIAQLNGMQVRVTTTTLSGGAAYIDTIDVVVEYAHQSPLGRAPAAGALALTGVAPTLSELLTKLPLVGSLALSGSAPTLQRFDILYPGETTLNLTSYAALAPVQFYRPTLLGSLALSAQSNVSITNHLAQPAVVALTLAGKVPVSEAVANFVALPGRRQLTLATEAPVVPTTTNATILSARAQGVLAGKALSIAHTTNIWSPVAVTAVALTGYAPTTVRSEQPAPAQGVLALSGKLGSVSLGTPLTPAAVSLALSTAQPATGGFAATLALAGQAPTALLEHYSSPTATTLALVGYSADSLNAARLPEAGGLALSTTGTAPTLFFTTSLTPGIPGIINLTPDHAIQFVATPTVILID